MQKLSRIRFYVRKGEKKVRATKHTPGAERVEEISDYWYGCWYDGGKLRRKRLYTDKDASQVALGQLIVQIERKQVGITDPFAEKLGKGLAGPIADYLRHLRYKGNGKRHLTDIRNKLNRITTSCGFAKIADLTRNRFAEWLGQHAERPSSGRACLVGAVAIHLPAGQCKAWSCIEDSVHNLALAGDLAFAPKDWLHTPPSAFPG